MRRKGYFMMILIDMSCVILAALLVAEVIVMLDILQERIGRGLYLLEIFCLIIIGVAIISLADGSMSNVILTMLFMLALAIAFIPEIEIDIKVVSMTMPIFFVSVISSAWKIIHGHGASGFYTVYGLIEEAQNGNGVLTAVSGFFITSAVIVMIANVTVEALRERERQLSLRKTL